MTQQVRIAALAFGLLMAAPAAGDDSEDVLGGFEDLDQYVDVIELPEEEEGTEDVERWWLFSGSLALQTSYNIREHESSTGTDYSGLSKLRGRAASGLDLDLGGNWRGSLNASGWYDAAYELRDADYTEQVLSEYKRDFQVREAWFGGPLLDALDIKLGRQVAVWGFADNVRVLDVLNPLDALEPGLADVEDLRLPVGMLRLDYYRGDWQASGFVVPEMRFSRLAPFGSDFYALVDGQGNALQFREEQPESFDSANYGLALKGRFVGWDATLNAARFWYDEPYLDASAFDSSDPNATQEDFEASAVLRHSRVDLLGFGLQATTGGWLFKQEAAYLRGLLLTTSGEPEQPLPALDGVPVVGGQGNGATLPMDSREVGRWDLLLGAEYYGFAQTSIGLEVAARHITDFADDLAQSGYLEWRGETTARVTRDFLNERLRVLFVAAIFNQRGELWSASGGGLYRISGDYELGNGLVTTLGAVVYEQGNQVPFTIIHPNDRVFGEIKWSF